MTDLLHAIMLNKVVNTVASSIFAIDANGKVTLAYINGHNGQRKAQRLIGKDIFKVMQGVLVPHHYAALYGLYEQCITNGQGTHMIKFGHTTMRGATEFFNCQFSLAQETEHVIFFVQNITEPTLIEEEFTNMSEQYEALNRELFVAMSKLEFQMMDLEQAQKKIAALYRITSVVQKTVNEQEVLEGILDGITRELGYTHVAIMLLDGSSQELTIKAQRGFARDYRIPLGQGITGMAALRRELIHVENVMTDARYINCNNDTVSEVAVPLVVDDKLWGVLNVETGNGRVLQTSDLDLLRSLASQVAMTIAHASHVSKVEIQATTDGLTGLYNYRFFRNVLQQEFKRASRYKRPLSLLMIDIDYFKHYNDTNGHIAGDAVLETVAGLIKAACRDVDYVIRYGGEEFAVLLPETYQEEAAILAERIRRSVELYDFPNGAAQPAGRLTVSIGASSYPQHAFFDIELIESADHALYNAKRTSRNCVRIYNSYEDDGQVQLASD